MKWIRFKISFTLNNQIRFNTILTLFLIWNKNKVNPYPHNSELIWFLNIREVILLGRRNQEIFSLERNLFFLLISKNKLLLEKKKEQSRKSASFQNNAKNSIKFHWIFQKHPSKMLFLETLKKMNKKVFSLRVSQMLRVKFLRRKRITIRLI